MSNRINLPAVQKPASPPWLPSLRGVMRAEWELVGNAKRKIWVLPEGRALTTSQSQELRAWLAEVEASLLLREGDEDRKAKSIARLYAVLASDRVPDEYLQVRMETWLDALSDRPAGEIEEAAMMWIRGDMPAEGEDRNFVPKPAQLLRLAGEARRRREGDTQWMHWLLSAHVDTPLLAEPQAPESPEMRRRVQEVIGETAMRRSA